MAILGHRPRLGPFVSHNSECDSLLSISVSILETIHKFWNLSPILNSGIVSPGPTPVEGIGVRIDFSDRLSILIPVLGIGGIENRES